MAKPKVELRRFRNIPESVRNFFGKKKPAKFIVPNASAEVPLAASPEKIRLRHLRTLMVKGMTQSPEFVEYCKGAKKNPVKAADFLLKKIETPDSPMWHRLAALHDKNRMIMHAKPFEEAKPSTQEEFDKLVKQTEERLMQKEGEVLANTFVKFEKAKITRTIRMMALNSAASKTGSPIIKLQKEFLVFWENLQKPRNQQFQEINAVYLEKIGDIWGDPKTNTKQKAVQEAEWVAGQFFTFSRA